MEDKATYRAQALNILETAALSIRPSVIVGTIYVLLIGFFVAVKHYSAMDFVHLGTVWSAHNPSGTWGYDGQFYYQIARNPLGAAQYMDNAPYRYQHFLYAFLAWMLSFGQATIVPYALLLINLASIVGSVEIASRLLSKRGLSPWFSLALGLYYGQAIGLTFDTTEPLTYFLISLGLWYLAEKRMLVNALCMGLAALSRETAVLFPICFVLSFLWKRQWKEAVGFIALGIIPLIILLLVLAQIFGRTGVTFAPPFEHIPFAGIFYFRQTPHKFWILVLMMLLPTLGSLAFLGWDLIRLRFSEMTLVWATNLGLTVFLSHFSYLELVSCGRVSIAPVLAGLFYAIHTRNKTLLYVLQLYIVTFAIYFIGTLMHLDSFIA